MQVDKELVLVRQTLCSEGLSHTGQSVFVSISGPPHFLRPVQSEWDCPRALGTDRTINGFGGCFLSPS